MVPFKTQLGTHLTPASSQLLLLVLCIPLRSTTPAPALALHLLQGADVTLAPICERANAENTIGPKSEKHASTKRKK